MSVWLAVMLLVDQRQATCNRIVARTPGRRCRRRARQGAAHSGSDGQEATTTVARARPPGLRQRWRSSCSSRPAWTMSLATAHAAGRVDHRGRVRDASSSLLHNTLAAVGGGVVVLLLVLLDYLKSAHPAATGLVRAPVRRRAGPGGPLAPRRPPADGRVPPGLRGNRRPGRAASSPRSASSRPWA